MKTQNAGLRVVLEVVTIFTLIVPCSVFAYLTHMDVPKFEPVKNQGVIATDISIKVPYDFSTTEVLNDTLMGDDIIGKPYLLLMMKSGIDTSSLLKPAVFFKIAKPSSYITDSLNTKKGDWCA